MQIEEISSPSNQRIKAAIALRDARERRDSGLLLIDGLSTAQHAISGNVELVELFIASKPDESHRQTLSYWESKTPNARLNIVSNQAMSKLQYGDRKEDLVAIARQPSLALESLEERIEQSDQKRLTNPHGTSMTTRYLVLDQVEKPGNLGAAIRTADAAGVQAILLSDPVSETWNPNTIRSSLGAIFRIPIAVGSAKQVQNWLISQKVGMYCARVDAQKHYTETIFPQSVAMVLGSEAEGLGANWNVEQTNSISIPMFGAVDSLNVSVSAAILLFEVLRQHQK